MQCNMTFQTLLPLARATVAIITVALCGLLVGPFQGAEALLGLNDVAAHALAAYGLSLLMFLIAPKRRRTDLAVMVLAGGIAVEVVQGLTGRSMSVLDVTANAAGIIAALAPGYIEQVRRAFREQPLATVGARDPRDRRQRGRTGPAAAEPAAARSVTLAGF